MYSKTINTVFAVILAIMFACVPFAHAETPIALLTKYGVPSVGSGQYEPVGRIFFVDSGSYYRADSADHGTWDKPFATLDYAVGRCTENNGDVIVLSPGHAENLAAADAVDVDVAGVRIIGLGEGNDRATFTYTATAGEFVIGAANVTVENLRFIAGISNITMGISVEAAGDNLLIKNCEVPEPGTATYDFADIIDLASGADNVTIDNFTVRQVGVTAGDLDHFIEAGNGVNNRLTIKNSVVEGEFAVSAIWSDTADTEVLIENCIITNATNGQHAIEFTSTARGSIVNTLVRTDAQGTAVDPGSLTMSNVLWDDNDVADSVATPVVAGGEASQALIDAGLDHLTATTGVAADADLTSFVADQSILSHIMSDGADTSEYRASTDSLEAIGTQVAAASLQGEAEDALEGEQLDHLQATTTGVAADGDLSTYAVDGSLMSHILTAGADTSDYQASTDSLEALSGAIATVDSNVDTIVADTPYLADSALPAAPTANSLAAFIASGGTALGTELGDSASIVDAIGADGAAILTVGAGSLYGASGQCFIVEKTLTSSAIVQAGVDVTAVASGGDIYIEDIVFETDGTGLAAGTNFTIEKDAGSGVLTFFGETVANLGANKTEVLSTGSVTPSNGTVLESGQKLVAKCTVADCTGGGTITLYIKARRVAAGANLTAAP